MTHIEHQWPVPAHWDDFEDMCYRLALANATIKSGRKYGRRGQEQHGVDIVGHTSDPAHLHIGIQCKLKTEHLGAKLSEADFRDAYELAKSLRPQLDRLYIATSPRDTAIADLVTQINESWQRHHFVEAWCWEDICDLLNAHKKVAARYYPDIVSIDDLQDTPHGPVELFLGAGSKSTGERLGRLFDHEVFIRQFGNARQEVANALTEYVLNCLHARKGGATRVTISLDGSDLVIEDNGSAFDPFNPEFEPTADQMGIRTIRALERNRLGLETVYIQKDPGGAHAFNQFLIQVEGMQGIATANCSVHLDAGMLFSRVDGHAFFDEMKIPDECNPFTVHLATARYATSSGSHEVVLRLKEHLGTRELVVVIPPYRPDLYEALAPAVSNWANVSLVMGRSPYGHADRPSGDELG